MKKKKKKEVSNSDTYRANVIKISKVNTQKPFGQRSDGKTDWFTPWKWVLIIFTLHYDIFVISFEFILVVLWNVSINFPKKTR